MLNTNHPTQSIIVASVDQYGLLLVYQIIADMFSIWFKDPWFLNWP